MIGLRMLDLSYTSIRELPNSLSDLECLNTLLLIHCLSLVSLPFLGKLKALRELDLSKTSITRGPNSISDLESVYRLCLSECLNLKFVPSLEKLEALRELDLSYTSIKYMPEGVKNLSNLKILLFRGAKYLKLQPGDLPIKSRNLHHLEFPIEIEVPVHEIESFKQLNRFVGRFKDVSDFNWFQSQTGGLISKFSYMVRNKCQGFDEYLCDLGSSRLRMDDGFISGLFVKNQFDKLVADLCCLDTNSLVMEGFSLRREGEGRVNIPPEKIEDLRIKECKRLSSCVFDAFKLCSSSVIEYLFIIDCEGMESIWHINDQLMAETQKKVKNLVLWGLPDLKCLVNWEGGGLGRLLCPTPQAAMIFSSLEELSICDCNKMKTLGLPLPCLHNITKIEVRNCAEIEELIDEDYEEEISEPTHSLPRLKRLILRKLPKLKSICKARIDCKSIKGIEITKCPRVKKLPLFLPSSSSSDGQVINYSPPPALKRIEIEEELWESLEWDDIRHKHLLQPSVSFY